MKENYPINEIFLFLIQNWVGCFLIIITFLLSTILFTLKLKTYLRKRRYLIRKNPRRILRIISIKITKMNFFERILNYITFKISVLNDESYEKNQEKSVVVLIVLLIFAISNFAIILPNVKIVWYLYLFYLILGGIFLTCIFYTIELMLRMHFTKLLPDTYKILNSRFTTEGDILKAIDRSLMDFKPAVRREMIRLRNVLRKNDRDKINATFKLMEEIYHNEYFTLLLNLIQQAYYKGGRDSIKQQFEIITEEILIDIENQKDLALTSRMYVAISLFLPLGLRWLEKFNERALGEVSREFYTSPLGLTYKILLLMSLLIYIVSLLFLERTV